MAGSWSPPSHDYLGGLEKVVPYLPGFSDNVKPYLAATDPARPLFQEFASVRTSANPWLSGRASAATLELRTPPSSGISAGRAARLTKAATEFDLGSIWGGIYVRPDYGATMTFETLFHPWTCRSSSGG